MTEKKQETGNKVGRGFPPKEHQFTGGYDPRRGHRPKGTPNGATVIRYVLSMEAQPPKKILQGLKEMYPVMFSKKSPKWTNEFLMGIRVAQKAIAEGDIHAYNAAMDRAYGKQGEQKLVIDVGGTRTKYAPKEEARKKTQ